MKILLKDRKREGYCNDYGLNGERARGMLFNPLAKVEIRMLVPIMIDRGKFMMDPKGSPEGHHDKEQKGQGD